MSSLSRSKSSVAAAYDTRAPNYDNATSFHHKLARQYLSYANPQPGESLLDLACGTGLVTFLFAPILQASSAMPKPKVVGVDISPGMLSIARSKTAHASSQGLELAFIEHDVTDLESVLELQPENARRGEKWKFDIITCCSALVLLSDPASSALKHWATYLKPGGRLVVDVPHPRSMLGVKITSLIAPEFGLHTLGDRAWILGPESLQRMMEQAGLEAKVLETQEWDDIPARTDREGGRTEWGVDEGAGLFDELVGSGSVFATLKQEQKARARDRFIEEWRKMGDGEDVVREVGKLFVGIGVKR